MSVQVSAKKQFVVYGLLLVILLSAVEMGARSYEWIFPNCSFVGSDTMKDVDIFKQRQICFESQEIQVKDLEFNPKNIPNQDSETTSINSHGFRGDEFQIDKEENVFRIFMLGGSTVFGTGATSDATTLPSQLERKLNEKAYEKEIQVINAGVSGATSFSEKNLLTHRIMDMEPDLIIVYDGWNDAWHRDRLADNENLDIIKEEKQNEGTGIIKILQENLGFYRTPLVIYKEFFWDKSWTYDSINEISVNKEISNIWKNNQKDMCQIAKESNVQSILILQPILGTGNKQLTPQELELFPKSEYDLITLETLNSFSENLESLRNFCTNTYDYRNEFDRISETLFFDKGHISDYGNSLIAEQIVIDIHQYIKHN